MTMEVTASDPLAALSVRRIRADLAAAGVQVGVAREHWRIGRLDYPILMVAVAASPQTYSPGWVDLRIDISGYPDQGVTACAWNVEDDAPLAADKRPVGGRATTVFRTDWESGRALYHPSDRIALVGHTDWPREHAEELWDPQQGIAKFLRLIHTILNEVDHAAAVESS